MQEQYRTGKNHCYCVFSFKSFDYWERQEELKILCTAKS